MRSIKNILFVALLLLTGCEVIPENEQLIPVEPDLSGSRTHVLLEFTGFRCVNCPTAAEIAQDLEAMYDGLLYVVSLHPASNPFTQGKYDYTCPAADSIYQWIGGEATTPFPAGNIDMQPFEGEWFADMSSWATMVYEAMKDSIAPSLDKAIKSYWLIEDSVLGVQAMPDGTVNDHYYHRHVLRDVNADKNLLEIKDSYTKQQLYVLTLYMDPNDRHIINAYETKLMDNSLSAMDD